MRSNTLVKTANLIFGALLILLCTGWLAPAFAQSCSPGEISQSFSFTGGQQSVAVPAGVDSATIFLSGAQGGNGLTGTGSGGISSPGGAGGRGGRVSGTLNVTPGNILSIGVGGQGSLAVNPGGASGIGSGGNGGGGTDIRLGGSRLAIAGGGGGGGNAGWTSGSVIAGGAGGNSGGTGSAGTDVGGLGPFGGDGGTPGGGGAGGAGCGSFPATAGQSSGQGGSSSNFSGSFSGAGFAGGGGGGSTVGGGGGGVGTTQCQQNWNGGGGGGGGGTSNASSLQSAAITEGVNSGNGSALVCFSSPEFVVSGTASGSTGTTVLELTTTNPANTETINVAGGSFAFTSKLPDATNWSVQVVTAPSGQICTVVPSSGVISGADANNLVLTCTTVQVDLAPQTLPDGIFGDPYNQTITASSSNGGTAPYTFAISAGSLPGGLSLTSAGVLSGEPNAVGSYNFTVQATASNGFTGQRQYAITIAAPTITVAPNQIADGQASNNYGPVTLSADGGTAPYTFQVTTGALPTGLTLTNADISGTPTVAGSFSFTVTATDANGFTGERQYTVAITAPGITVEPATLPGGKVANIYGPVALSADGGAGPYSFQVTVGTLPNGLTLTNNEISGIPIATGSFTFTITATDANGFTGERQYTVAVDPPGISVEPATLPGGKVANAYGPIALSSDGGIGPYSFQVTAGTLPSGLTLTNNEISGTPTATGSFAFTITTTDANGFTGERQYTVAVDPPGIAIGPANPPERYLTG